MNAKIAGPADISGIIDTLADAFFEDPVWGWAFSDPIRRRAQYGVWFEIIIASAVKHRWVWTTPAHEAASVWLPPGCPELSKADEVRLDQQLGRTIGERALLLREIFECFEASHPRDREHFYLSLLGTHTNHRGLGIGMELLAANLATIDALHMPAYLESTNPNNLTRYESVGFEIYGTFGLPGGGPDVTQMWREPSPQV